MKKSTSLCEFSTTPSVSLMRDKTGQNIGGGAMPPQQKVQSNKPELKPASKAGAKDEEDDMFQLEGV